jgi:DNA repair protein RecO (recombination protein O)
VVLRRQDFGEADRVLTLYSPRIGKFRAVAKGVRRLKSRLGGNVELFTHVSLLIAQGRNLDVVTQAEALRTFRSIRDDLWKAAYACYAAELVDRFVEDRLENAAVFDLLLATFDHLDRLEASAAPGVVRDGGATDAGGAVELAIRNFEMKILGCLGYAPEVYRCVQCGERLTPEANRFSPANGGVLCAACAAAHPGAREISVPAIKTLRLMGSEPFGIFRRLRLAHEPAAEVEGALRAHINYVLERQLRTTEFLDRLKSEARRERRLAAAAAG